MSDYVKQEWVDNETLINAERLNHIEDGIYAAGGEAPIEKITVNDEEQPIEDKTVNIEVPTKTSELTNDSGYIDDSALSDYAKTSDVETVKETAESALEAANEVKDTAAEALEKAQEVEESAITGVSVNGDPLEVIEHVVDVIVPTKTSELENDSDYTTTEATKEEIAAQIAEIVAGAPESLDTLKEIADWIEGHAKDAAEMNSQIKQNAEDIEALQDLIGELPASASSVVEYIEAVAGEIPTKVSELENDANYVDQEALDAVGKQADEALEKARAVEDAAITGINVNGTPAKITDHIADIEVSGGGGYSISYDGPEEALVFAAGAGITYDEPTETLIF